MGLLLFQLNQCHDSGKEDIIYHLYSLFFLLTIFFFFLGELLL